MASYGSQNFALRIVEEWNDSGDDDQQNITNDVIIISDSDTSSNQELNKVQSKKQIYNEIISDSDSTSIFLPNNETHLISNSDDTEISPSVQIQNSLLPLKPPKRANNLKNISISTNNTVDSKKHLALKANDLSINKVHPHNLPEFKKKYVAEWIKTNPPEPNNDSCSHISESIRSNESSGNSSLERLEMIYETPNNRHKFRNIRTKNHEISSKNTNESFRVEVTDCADVLDRLYGTKWRAQSTSTKTTNRKKQASKSHQKINKKEVKKRTTKIRDSSFINDSSESETESIYHTALMNLPTFGKNHRNKPKPTSELTKRLLTLCDPDTEDEGPPVRNPIFKKLSYGSEDDTSTSEFDPNDQILPKAKKKIDKKRPDPIGPSKHEGFLNSLSEFVPMNNVHCSAIKYRRDYKNTKDDLAKYLFKLYNEKVFENKLPMDMEIQWNVRMRGTAGFCYNKKITKAIGGVVRSSRIALSTKILDKPDRLRDTLIHEMCHSAAWIINGVSDGHGPFWKSWASKAMKTFPELPAIKRCHDYTINTKFTYRCTGCGYSIGRHSKSLNIQRKRCGHCFGEFELLINRTTKSGNFRMDTPSKREPSAFALYVKENYSTVKKDNGRRKHGDVMKLLGQQFSALKVAQQKIND